MIFRQLYYQYYNQIIAAGNRYLITVKKETNATIVVATVTYHVVEINDAAAQIQTISAPETLVPQ